MAELFDTVKQNRGEYVHGTRRPPSSTRGSAGCRARRTRRTWSRRDQPAGRRPTRRPVTRLAQIPLRGPVRVAHRDRHRRVSCTGGHLSGVHESDAQRQLAALGRAYIDFGLSHPALFELMFTPSELHAADAELIAAQQQAIGCVDHRGEPASRNRRDAVKHPAAGADQLGARPRPSGTCP